MIFRDPTPPQNPAPESGLSSPLMLPLWACSSNDFPAVKAANLPKDTETTVEVS